MIVRRNVYTYGLYEPYMVSQHITFPFSFEEICENTTPEEFGSIVRNLEKEELIEYK